MRCCLRMLARLFALVDLLCMLWWLRLAGLGFAMFALVVSSFCAVVCVV